MVESNKILTVSYGTFSCTLEGFDDAFDTMKAIAEYFRDLAADDRYFGAEPPTPDADMLARLAERSISRRVTARSEDGNIVLSPDAQQAAAAPQPAPASKAQGTASRPEPTPQPETQADSGAPAPAAARPDEDDEDGPAPQPQRAPRIAAALAAAGGAALLASAPARAATDEAQVPETPAEDLPKADSEAVAEIVETIPDTDQGDTEPSDPEATEAEASSPAEARTLTEADPVDADALEAPIETADPLTTAPEAGATGPQNDEIAQDAGDDLLDAAPTVDAVTADDSAQIEAPVEEGESLDTLLADTEDEAPEEQTLDALLLDTPLPADADDAETISDAPELVAPEEDDLHAGTDPAPRDAPLSEVDAPAATDDAESAEGAILVEDAAAPEGDEAIELADLAAEGDGQDSIAEAADAIYAARAREAEDLPVAPARPDVTDVALKLQRIRDVVARRRALAESLAAPVDLAAQEEDSAPLPPIADEEAAFSSTIGAAEAEDDLSEDSEGADSLFSDDGDDSDLDGAPRVMARVVKVKRRADVAPEESTLSPEDEAELQRELAALEDEIASSNAATGVSPDEMDEDAPAPDLTADDLLTDEPMAAEVPDEGAASEENDTPAAEAPAARARPTARDTLRATDHSDQMDRILRETDHQFEQEDSTRRRSALAHLRAAVAAKKAEKAAGSDFAAREDTTDAYREDLAQVVRPRRPAIAHHGTAPARRLDSRPAPLKLVAEQRVDVSAAPRGPVRPRRISVADLARHDSGEQRREAAAAPQVPARTPDESFEDYAASVGASSLGDLLEAAASYMCFLEGQPLFSRPQLMTRVKTLAPDEYSREDGLRAFGQLLRDGKIRKAEAGRFTVSDSIGFRPEKRAAG
ncbi:hypothetical protein KUV28_11070 [Ferrimonas balearica]|nr:hypothetical protein [Ferrimonas balearica]